VVKQTEYPAAAGSPPAVELSIDEASFRDAFAADLPGAEAAVMAASQRPIAASSFAEKNGPPAWKKLPSWAVVATGDKAAGSDAVMSMARRAGAKITEVEASHVVMISHPDEVTDVVRMALQAVA
jgi:pimeloyl-ACP methyl ester carboxylesterase